MAVVWVTGFLKVGAALLALALVRPWGRSLPRRALLVAGWGTGAFLTLYGGAGIVTSALVELGLTEATDPTTVRWYLLLWEPIWLLGGLLFTAAAWQHRRIVRRHPVAAA